MEEIGKILPAVFKRHVQRADPLLVEILAPLWPLVVGKGIARQARPVAFEGGTLTLATACPSWAAQLRQMSEEISAGINSFLGCAAVKKLRVTCISSVEPPAAPPRWPGGAEAEIPKIAAPDGTAKLDPDSARILERSFAKYFAREKGRAH